MKAGVSKMSRNEQMDVLLSPCVVKTVPGGPVCSTRTVFLFSTLKNTSLQFMSPASSKDTLSVHMGGLLSLLSRESQKR